ncbi:Carbon catabolite-derepressing protein kinase like [Verticillium longisporum]|uniref:non-specific serine/threonine protein kinase n=2 Tax=Verticillium longisporum TaxID=100787 RepID=A0A0G4LE96_VERLO|nr:Carbon catabolite-derepressing protein kinase like [Verticillium longisporum]CRK20316.1 hypothetical protein BN1708_012825 [Verticillium longisporum]
MIASLRSPFPSLCADNFLSRGAGGQVFTISPRIVFKCPTSFQNPAPEQQEEAEESDERITREKEVYELLIKRPHPNIIRCILIVPEGIFLERMEMTLEARIDDQSLHPTSANVHMRWIRQITNALSWLENLGIAHGDLRPANLLLTRDEQIRLADFDSSVPIGHQLRVASEPFCKLHDDFALPEAGAASEQFALASCIYTIRFGHIPLRELDAPSRIQKMMRHDFPSTKKDDIFGHVTLKCWQGKYNSIAAVYHEVQSCHKAEWEVESPETLGHEIATLTSECETFLAKEGSTWRNLLQDLS